MSKIIDSVRLPYKVAVAATGTGTISSDRVKTQRAVETIAGKTE